MIKLYMLIFYFWSPDVDRVEVAQFDTIEECQHQRDKEVERIPSREFICSK